MSFRPTAIREVELSEPVAAINANGYRDALVLVRWYSEPLALVNVPLTDGTAPADRVARALWPQAAAPVARRCQEAGQLVPAAQPLTVGAGTADDGRRLPGREDHPAGQRRPVGPASTASPAADDFPAALLRTGLQLPWPPAYLLGRATTLRNAAPISVVVCTRDRADKLACCLAAVLGQDYPDFELIVVDNAPLTSAVADLVAGLRPAGAARGIPVRRVVEPRPGLSWARNAGLAAASGKIVAYLDDDERPDRHWLAELARGFTLGKRVAGVSGLVLPERLDTEAQVLYEEFGGHSKGRGFTHEIFDPASHQRQHPLYPLPAFGVGASLAFDRAALTQIGGFDVALGAGTPARAGEDTAAIADVMLDGGTFVYWPGAVMWHLHRATVPEVERQLNGYGSGLAAFYTRALLRHPAHLATLARLAPRALHDLRGHDSVRTATMGADYPAALRRASAQGMLAGPLRYLRSRQVQERVKAECG
jgi:glycosyltransferase involved in cell wall biosynthesis